MSLKIKSNSEGDVTLTQGALYVFYTREDRSPSPTRIGNWLTASYMINSNYFLKLTS